MHDHLWNFIHAERKNSVNFWTRGSFSHEIFLIKIFNVSFMEKELSVGDFREKGSISLNHQNFKE